MHRVAPVILLVGVALVTTWSLSRAQPGTSPLPRPTVAPDLPPLVQQVLTEAQRLDDRLQIQRPTPQPVRNPFRYVDSRSTDAPPAAEAADPMVDRPSPAPFVTAPQLVAIVEGLTGTGGRLQAALSFVSDDEVHVVAAGDTVGDFFVESVTVDTVVLRHEPTASIRRLSLR